MRPPVLHYLGAGRDGYNHAPVCGVHPSRGRSMTPDVRFVECRRCKRWLASVEKQTSVPRTLLDSAVRAMQLYMGSEGARIRDQQKLYNRAHKLAESVAAKTGLSSMEVWEQVGAEAQRRGALRPMPGKDI